MLGLSPETRKAMLLSVGSHREVRSLSPVEVAQALGASMEAGSSLRELAAALHLEGTSMVSRFVRLLNLSPEIQHLVDWGESKSTIGFTAASELARLPNRDDQIKVCHAALENQLKSSEVKQIVQLQLRLKRSVSESIDQVLRQRRRVERLHIFIGAVTSEKVISKLRALRQNQRDELLQKVLQERYPKLADFASRLGAERFTITGDDSVAAALSSDSQDFESTINTALSREIHES